MKDQLPTKMRIVQMLLQKEEMWDYEIVERLLSEYDERFVKPQRINSYLSEMKASDLIEDVNRAIPSTKNPLLNTELSYRFRLTALGVRRANLYSLRGR